MIHAFLNYAFMQNALAVGVLASVACGFIGVIIIEKKLVMMSGGIAHVSYGGVGLGYLLGIEPIIGALIFALAGALGIGYLKDKSKTGVDVVISLLWSAGMALGVLFVALTPGYPPDLSSYLFGNILAVTKSGLYFVGVLTVVVVAVVWVFFENWKSYLFDEEFSLIRGVWVKFLRYLLLALIALTVVALIRVVGIILSLALLTAPAATSSLFAKSLEKRIIYAVIIGNIYSFSGLCVSYALDMSSGAVIVVISVLCYFAAFGVKKVLDIIKAASFAGGSKV